MKALFVHDARYIRKNSEVYTELEFSYDSWVRMLEYFDEIRIIGREFNPPKDIYDKVETYNKCSGTRVSFSLYPRLTTIKGGFKNYQHVTKSIREDVKNADAVVIRGGQENAWLAFKAAYKLNKPIALEGTGCLWNNAWHHSSLLGKLYAPLLYIRARKMYKHADAVIYVTENFLQKRYPAGKFSSFASDVKLDLPNKKILENRLKKIRNYNSDHIYKFGIIGPLHNNHKGIDKAVKAFSILNIKFELHLLGRGDGHKLQTFADELGIGHNLHFDGLLPKNKVKDWLDNLDIYLQPSRTEGLPRATLEAMSRALPVITSDAGDMPAVIDRHFVHSRHDVSALSSCIKRIMQDKDTLSKQAKRNFDKIKTDFHPDTLEEKRKDFWDTFFDNVKQRTAKQNAS